MGLKIAETSPTSAVASAGTITFSYPTGTSAGSFANFGHKLWASGLQSMFTQDNGQISVSFGTSDITATYNGSTSIPANSDVSVQLNLRGQDDGEPDLEGMDRMALAPLVRIDLGSPDTADPNGIVESQDLTSAGVFSVLAFNGVIGDVSSNTKAVLDVPRNVVAAWTTNAVLTITGKDEYGDVIVESSAGGSATFTGKKAFKEVTSIATDTNITGLTVGTGDVLGLPVFVEGANQILGEMEDNRLLDRSPRIVRVPFQIDQVDCLAGTPISVRCPVNGTLKSLQTIVWKTVGTGGNVTMKVNNTEVDGLAVVVADSAPAGALDSDTPTSGHASTVLAVDDELEIICASEFATTGALTGFVEIELTDAQMLDGTFVAGVQTAPTATTGDVKGTYDPTTVADGATAFSLLASLPDPQYKGVDNFDG